MRRFAECARQIGNRLGPDIPYLEFTHRDRLNDVAKAGHTSERRLAGVESRSPFIVKSMAFVLKKMGIRYPSDFRCHSPVVFSMYGLNRRGAAIVI